MRFSVLQENLSQGLSTVGKAVATKGSLPVLANVLIATDEGRLKLAATNLETGIITWVGAKVEENGAVTIPARLLTEFVGNLPPEQINGAVANNLLTITTPTASSTFNGVDAAEFPALPQYPSETSLTFDPKLLAAAISEVAFAAAADEGRPILTGVLLKVTGEQAVLVGVDGFRLAERRITLSPAAKKDFSVVIPARTLQEIVRLLGAEKGTIEAAMIPEGNQVVFKGENILVFSQLLEGEYPDYAKIIPAEHSLTATFNRDELQKSVRLASVFARDSTSIVKFKVEPEEGRIKVSAAASELGEGMSQLAAQIEGEGLTIAFNSRYLADLLTNLKSEELVLTTAGNLAPAVFRPVGREDYLHIIMPVRVQE